MKDFTLTGAAGYIASHQMRAGAYTGKWLAKAGGPSDSVATGLS